jgi:septal ring factor EnvC (AmiA/AmiB activator)
MAGGSENQPTNQPNSLDKNGSTAPAYIKMVRVPVWVVRVTSGLIVILTAGTAAAFLLVVLWIVLLTIGLTGHRAEVKKARIEIKKLEEAAAKQRVKNTAELKEELEKIKEEIGTVKEQVNPTTKKD